MAVVGVSTMTTVLQVVDGFNSLSTEYKRLAEQCHALEISLTETTKECEKLRLLLPDNVIVDNQRTESSLGDPKVVRLRRTLDEWLETMTTSKEPEAMQALSKIKEAQLACYKIQDKYKSRLKKVPLKTSAEPSSDPKFGSCPISHANFEVEDTELDFTRHGTPGKLGCPYATSRDQKTPSKESPYAQHDLPTPKSSASLRPPEIRVPDQRALSSSSHPARGAVSFPTSNVDSASAPACPIRFLGQQSAEDVAKYFEEHKHEIPKSHENCVKRFQANADSIAELDAKYGSLVTMIQGLGQKHQPMLPETPRPDGAEGDEEEHDDDKPMSDKKVREWASGVGDPLELHGIDKVDPADPAAEDTNDDEARVSHFSRPLKEIRVGESPSRPWGIPVPKRGMNRMDSELTATTTASRDPASIALELDARDLPKHSEPASNEATAKAELGSLPPPPLKSEELEQSTVAKAGGKCPFDHQALAAMKDAAKVNGPLAQVPVLPPSAVAATEAAKGVPEDSSTKPTRQAAEGKEDDLRAAIINHGIAIIADSSHLAGQNFTNYGTLVLGYDESMCKMALSGKK